jgi:hypothetical protein
MQTNIESTTFALNQLLDPLSHSLGDEAAQQILALRIAPEVQARIDALADPCNEGLLTDAERAEYMGYVDGISLINILKAKVQRVLALRSSSSS